MILMNDFTKEPPQLRDQILQAIGRVLNSGWYVLGKECETFEQAWATYCGADYAIGVGNGLDAIEIALRAKGVGPGDEVITTPMTAFATVLAVLRAGATPVLADIDPQTALLSMDSAARCLSRRTKAVVLVHLYGQIRNMAEWQSFCRENRLALIEDCAQAHGATDGKTMAGAFGDAAAFSFYPTKNLGTVGDGGMVLTNDAELADRSRQLRNYGQSVRYEHPVLGLNSRLDEIHAAILSARLGWLEQFNNRRREIAAYYSANIRHSAVTALAPPQLSESHVFHLYVVRCANRQALIEHLHERQVQALIHYPIPVHRQASCFAIARDPSGLPHADEHARTCLSLPCHPLLSNAQVAMIAEAVNSFGH